LALKDGTELSGIFEGLRDDRVLLADGSQIAFPSEIPLQQTASVWLDISSEGPE
jgi:hypothetical protein